MGENNFFSFFNEIVKGVMKMMCMVFVLIDEVVKFDVIFENKLFCMNYGVFLGYVV